MAACRMVFPRPTPSGVELQLTMKEAFALREFLGRRTKVNDPGGQILNILNTLCSDEILGTPIG